MTSKRMIVPLVAALLLALAPAPGVSWDATDGVVLPVPSLVDQDEPVALAINPANLGFMNSWSLMYVGAHTVEVAQQTVTEGSGHGIYIGTHVFGPLALAASLDILFPPDIYTQTFGLDDRFRLSLGMALRLADGLSLGLAYRHIFSEEPYGLDGLDTADFGLSIRPTNWLAFAMDIRDIGTPQITTHLGNREVSRRYLFGAMLRPLSSDLLSAGVEVSYADIANQTDLRVLLGTDPVSGIELRLGGGFYDVSDKTAYTLEGAVAINFAQFGAGFGTSGRVHPDPYMVSYSWWARVSGVEYPSLWRHDRIPVVEIREPESTYEFAALIRLFERMERDSAVPAVLLRLEGDALPFAIAQELRGRVAALKRAGKQVFCHMNSAEGSSYYACAGASRVWINPAGGIWLTGIKSQRFFLRELLDKIGVRADIVRIGKYKSSPEMFMEKEPTEPAREELDSMLDSVYRWFVSDLASDRGLSEEKVRKLIDNGPYVAQEALEAGLVDELVYNDQLEDTVWKTLGSESAFDEHYGDGDEKPSRYLRYPKVAVLHIEGTLVEGESMEIPWLGFRTAGAATIAKTLREIARDEDVETVVLRIDSPGGSALASDIIWREIMALRKEKPVVASMGAMATSGAYYIASAANEIYAEPATLTGSIGIFYGKADLSGLLDKVGIGVFTTTRGKRADMESWFRPYTDDEREELKRKISHFYGLFVDKVVEGRGRGFKTEIVDDLGRGRIWSGAQAHWRLLVDHIGGLSEATEAARSLAKIGPEAVVVDLPKKESLISRLIHTLLNSGSDEESSPFPIPSSLRMVVRSVMPFVMSAQDHAPLALCPYIVEMK